MSKRIPSAEERSICQRLRQEAMNDRPEFSESLHRGILSAIQEHGLASGGADILVCPRDASGHDRQECLPHPGEKRWRAYMTAALTAACLLIAVAVGWLVTQRDIAVAPAAAPAVAVLPPFEELAGSTLESLNDLIASAASVPQSADIEQGVLLAADELLHPLPINLDLAAGP
jgi:hypothetical protein